MLTVLEYLAAIAVGYVIVRYIVIPAIRKNNDASTGAGSQSPREGNNDRL